MPKVNESIIEHWTKVNTSNDMSMLKLLQLGQHMFLKDLKDMSGTLYVLSMILVLILMRLVHQ